MKHLHTLSLAAALLLGTAVHAQTPARNASGAPVPMASYGKAITPDGAISANDLVTRMKGQENLKAKVAVEVITSCARKGCWMDVALPNGEVMKVRFADYAFFVPTEGLAGKRAILEGTASQEVIDVATQRHYAEDAGKSKEEIAKITEPKIAYTFLADGVLIGD
ncbi:MAG: DUF4920 domain-containing protein [Flavobacteriales bacterium]|nr:DUF4920 domain-containing protein [Flavobacteriales bacterium]